MDLCAIGGRKYLKKFLASVAESQMCVCVCVCECVCVCVCVCVCAYIFMDAGMGSNLNGVGKSLKSYKRKNFLSLVLMSTYGFPGVKNLPVNAADANSIPGLGRFSGEGNGNPL